MTTQEAYRNRDFQVARNAKKDEFYTQLSDIELELQHYRQQFKGKVVYCNCDDPRASNFFRYFCSNFETLGLRRLITSRTRVRMPVGGRRRAGRPPRVRR